MQQSKRVFFLSAIALLLITGCRDKSNLLAKTWKLKDLKYTIEIPPAMKPAVEEQIQKMRESFRLTYKNDGTYLSEMNEHKMEGKWKLNGSSTELTSTSNNGDTKTYKIEKLTKDEYWFEADEKGAKVTFVMIPA